MWFLYVYLVVHIVPTSHMGGFQAFALCTTTPYCGMYFVRYAFNAWLNLSLGFWVFDLVVKPLFLVPRFIPRLAQDFIEWSYKTVPLHVAKSEIKYRASGMQLAIHSDASYLYVAANLGINLGTRIKGLTTRSHTQNPRLRLSQTLNTYLTKYLPY